MNDPLRLRILVVAADARDGRFAARVLEERGDAVEIALRVPDALERLARGDVDVALVSLSLPRGDGLALVHHLRALHPLVDVLVVTTPQDLEEASHAMALGVTQTVMRPLTGDALLVAIDRARERRMLVAQRNALGEQARRGKARTATYARCAAFVAETDHRIVAERILRTCAEELELAAGAIYVPPYPGANSYLRTATVADGADLPESLDEEALAAFDPTEPVQEDEAVLRLLFLGEQDVNACAVLVPLAPLDEGAREALGIVASLGTAALMAARKVDAIARTGLKDPDTSAYTFAYFGDVAGREIDRAARHGRRFALITLGLTGLEAHAHRLPPDARLGLRRLVTDAVLAAVRDSDVLARVEEDEFYLLLPETGLLGALAARRRIRARFAALPELDALLAEVGVDLSSLDLACGIAVYPVDGSDLGRLLRTSRRRADQSSRGVWRRLGLAEMPFWDALDRLVGDDRGVVVHGDGGFTLDAALEAAHADDAQHALLPRELLPRIGQALVEDAASHRVPGVVYVAGDEGLAGALLGVLDRPDLGPVRGWVLDGSGRPADEPRRLAVSDPRLTERVLLLGLTELGGYLLAARRVETPARLGDALFAYHASNVDLVDGLVTALQRTYPLQPELGE